MGNFLFQQSTMSRREMFQGLYNLFDPAHHREENADIRTIGCPEDSPQLCLKHLGMAQRPSDAANAQRRIIFGGHARTGDRLVPPDIQCPHDNRSIGKTACDRAQSFDLFRFRRQGFTGEVEKFRAEHTDTVRAVASSHPGADHVPEIRANDDSASVT